MPKIRVINIVDFLMRNDNPEMVQPVIFAYEKAPFREATDVFKVFDIQLPVFRKKYKSFESGKGDTFLTWLYLLDRGYKDKNEMEALSMMPEGMMTFTRQYNIAINDTDLRSLYRMEQDAKRDEASRLWNAEKRGEENAAKRIVRNMVEQGIPIDVIQSVTGFTQEQINSL